MDDIYGRPHARHSEVARLTRVALQLLLVEELVGIARAAVDRNRLGDETPTPAFVRLDTLLDNYDKLGGTDSLWLDVFSAEGWGSATRGGSGWDRAGSDAATRPAEPVGPLESNGFGWDRAESDGPAERAT